MQDRYGQFFLFEQHSETRLDPEVSVLMAVYNGESSVSAAIDSVIGQTFSDFEFLIVDDGSSDGTLALLQEYARQDSRIRIVTQTNMGLTKSLNRALLLARGTFIARQDDDDTWLPEKLSKQVAYLRTHPETSLLGTRYEVVDTAGNTFEAQGKMRISGNMALRHALDFYNPFMHASIMARRQQVLTCGGYDDTYKVAQDYELWLRLRTLGELEILPDVHCLRREAALPATAKKRRQQRLNVFRAKRKHGLFTDFPRLVSGFRDICAAFLPERLQQMLLATQRL